MCYGYFHTEEYKGYTINVGYSECDESPLEWDMLGTIYSNHRQYDPCNHKMDEIIEFDDEGNWHVQDDYIYIKISAYIHSGIVLKPIDADSTCPQGWDCGLFGLMVVSKDKVIKEYGSLSQNNIDRAISCLKGEVETWSQYLNGEVYCYSVDNPEGEFVDSCSGFYGGYDKDSDLMYYAKDFIDSDIERREKEAERIKKLENAIDPFYID